MKLIIRVGENDGSLSTVWGKVSDVSTTTVYRPVLSDTRTLIGESKDKNRFLLLGRNVSPPTDRFQRQRNPSARLVVSGVFEPSIQGALWGDFGIRRSV